MRMAVGSPQTNRALAARPTRRVWMRLQLAAARRMACAAHPAALIAPPPPARQPHPTDMRPRKGGSEHQRSPAGRDDTRRTSSSGLRTPLGGPRPRCTPSPSRPGPHCTHTRGGHAVRPSGRDAGPRARGSAEWRLGSGEAARATPWRLADALEQHVLDARAARRHVVSMRAPPPRPTCRRQPARGRGDGFPGAPWLIKISVPQNILFHKSSEGLARGVGWAAACAHGDVGT